MRYDITRLATNKAMNNETYQLKRKVIDIIYNLKKYVELPRITVRIAERNHKFLGVGRMNDNIIWICENSFNSNSRLFQVVLHEILHAVKGIEHNEKCDLMCSVIRNIPENKALELFLGYFKH